MENQDISPASAQNVDRPDGLPKPIYADTGEPVGQPQGGSPSHDDHASRNQAQMGSDGAPQRPARDEGNPNGDDGDDQMDDAMDDDQDEAELPDSENPDRPDRPGQPMA